MDAFSARVETDEGGVYLVVSTLIDTYRYRLAMPVAEELYDTARSDILPWLREREEAHAEFKANVEAGAYRCADPEWEWVRDQLRDAYDASDPKHPDFHSVHADHYDAREGK